MESSAVEKYREFVLKPGDVLIAMSGATTGKTAVYWSEESALLNQRVGRFQVIAKAFLNGDYLAFLIDYLRGAILKAAYGGAQPNISGSRIEEFVIPLAPAGEQLAITRTLEDVFTRRLLLADQVKEAETQLSVLEQSILAKAFRGELVPQDPATNPLPPSLKDQL